MGIDNHLARKPGPGRLITLMMKFLIFSLALLQHSFMPLPFFLSLVTRKKRPAQSETETFRCLSLKTEYLHNKKGKFCNKIENDSIMG